MSGAQVRLVANFSAQFGFVACVEANNTASVAYASLARACAAEAGLGDTSAEAILRCFGGPDALAYEHAMAAATPGDHAYVPWIIIDGVHDEAAQTAAQADLLEYVCATYKGPHRSGDCPASAQERRPAAPPAATGRCYAGGAGPSGTPAAGARAPPPPPVGGVTGQLEVFSVTAMSAELRGWVRGGACAAAAPPRNPMKLGWKVHDPASRLSYGCRRAGRRCWMWSVTSRAWHRRSA
jgi:hypothetical protein